MLPVWKSEGIHTATTGKTNQSEFCDSLDQAKQLLNIQYNEEGDETHPVTSNKAGNEWFTRPSRSPIE